ncbi:MAG: DUF2490 domain-containing protein [Verrucomicrobiota bacterium]
MKVVQWIGFILGFLTFSLNAQQSRAFEFWSSQGISQRLDYGLELLLENEERLSSGNGTAFRSEEITPSLIWHYSPRYDFQVGYDGEMEWDAEENLMTDHRGFVVATVKVPYGKWNLISKQRFDAGDREGKTVSDFRHAVRLETSVFSERWLPYLSDEWFLDLVGGRLEENRAQIGVLYRWNRAWETEVYGMRRDLWSEGSGMSSYGLIFGLNFRMKF